MALAKKRKAGETVLDGWSEVIRRQGEQARREQDELVARLTKQTKELDPSDMDAEQLIDVFAQTRCRMGSYDPREAKQYSIAYEKLRQEILRRMGG